MGLIAGLEVLETRKNLLPCKKSKQHSSVVQSVSQSLHRHSSVIKEIKKINDLLKLSTRLATSMNIPFMHKFVNKNCFSL